jgi:hypothetical protein
MNEESSRLLLEEVRQLRKLVELIAEPAIAQRDAKFRATLREIVGASAKQQRAIHLMNGTRSQKEIGTEASLHKGQLSVMVSKLADAKLLSEDKKRPALVISIPPNFFETT